MRFGSVCSGIEAASVAWNPLGWKAQWLAEIEPFPCALLKHHYPETPNLGDMTKFNEWPTDDKHAIDLLCGGTPCQSFSVAGLRKGLDDPRGNLMLTFGAIAAKYRPQWLVWENVPGVLSSNGGADFGAFLGMLGQLGYGFAYRVLDAQYFGVAQRRRRVFVVGCFGDWRSAAAVLFERHSLQGHPAPSRKAGKGFAAEFAPSLTASGRGVERCGDTRGQDPVIAVAAFGGNNTSGSIDVATALRARGTFHYDFESETLLAGTLQANGKAAGSATQQDAESGMLVTTHTLRGEGFDASEDGTGRGTPLVPVLQYDHACTCGNDFFGAINALCPACGGGNGAIHGEALEVLQPGPIAYRTAGDGAVFEEGDRTAPLTTGTDPCANILAFDTTQVTSVANRSNPKVGDPCHPLAAGGHAPAIAFDSRMRGAEPAVGREERPPQTMVERTGAIDATKPWNVASGMAVRRLTPMECERLQGFPDNYTAIPHRNKPAADGPRYKSLGNSWAVPNVRWIGERIEAVALVNSEQQAIKVRAA